MVLRNMFDQRPVTLIYFTEVDNHIHLRTYSSPHLVRSLY